MKKTIATTLVLLTCLVTPLAAQHLTEHYRDKDLVPAVAYGLQETPRIWTRPLPAPGALLAFQFPRYSDTTWPVRVEAVLTTGGPELHANLVTPTCVQIPGGYDCRTPIPPTVRLAWATITGIRVRAVDGLTPPLEASALLAVQAQTPDPPRTCRYTMPDGSVQTRPVDTSVGGYLSNADLQVASAKIGQWRRDGWRVEWQFVPATGYLGAGSVDRIVFQMWCFGTPQ